MIFLPHSCRDIPNRRLKTCYYTRVISFQQKNVRLANFQWMDTSSKTLLSLFLKYYLQKLYFFTKNWLQENSNLTKPKQSRDRPHLTLELIRYQFSELLWNNIEASNYLESSVLLLLDIRYFTVQVCRLYSPLLTILTPLRRLYTLWALPLVKRPFRKGKEYSILYRRVMWLHHFKL